MYSWVRLSHVAQWMGGAFHGKAAGDPPVTALSTDTRTLRPGDIFLALRGENFDGNAYAAAAVKAGAAAVIVEKPLDLPVPVLVVSDGLRALASVARELRNQFTGRCIAVTGSAGKSSTKEMISTLLGERTVASPASFNNLLGASKTLCLLQDSTENLVMEMGMNALGEIAELCRYFRPQAGLITNIGDAHIGKLGGREGIYRAKKELFDGIQSEPSSIGVALNLDDSMVERAYRESGCDRLKTVTYSAEGKPADVRILSRRLDPVTAELALEMEVAGDRFTESLPIFGLHHTQNLAAATAAVWLLGTAIPELRKRYRSIRPAEHRGEIVSLSGGRVLIDESYNSNPSALGSSLESLAGIAPERRRVLVLGEMKELGEFSASLHRQAGEKLAGLQARVGFPFLLLGVGSEALPLVEAVRAHGVGECFALDRQEEVIPFLRGHLRAGDVIFIKGSHGVHLEKVAERLAEERADSAS